MGDERDAKAGFGYVHHGQAHAVHGHGALGHHLLSQLAGTIKPDGFPVTIPPSFGDTTNAIDVALDKMATETIAQAQRALQVHPVARSQLAKVGSDQRLRSGLEAACRGIVSHHRQAGAVDSHAFAQRKLPGKISGDDQSPPCAFRAKLAHGAECFNKSGEHDDYRAALSSNPWLAAGTRARCLRKRV